MRAELTEQAAALTVEATSRTLRLPTVREQAGPLAEAALRDRVSHLAYLAELLSSELDPVLLAALERGEWVERGESVVLLGDSGTGKSHLLCLDELGYLQLDRRGAELLFQVLTEREAQASVAVASNAPFSEWGQTFVDPRLAAAVVDRLTFRAHIIETGSESYRPRVRRFSLRIATRVASVQQTGQDRGR